MEGSEHVSLFCQVILRCLDLCATAEEVEDAVVPSLSANERATQHDLNDCKLNDAVYLAHKGNGSRRGAQIVFIHGLQFQEDKNPFPENWLSEDGNDLWPKSWLSDSFPTADIYLVDYDSSTSKDDKSGRLDMFATGERLLLNLLLAKIGQSPGNPVILIGQDIGGLVIKEICWQAFFGASLAIDTGDAMDHKKRSFLQQVKGVFYFSTPHGGIRHWDQADQGELMKNLKVYNAATSRTNNDFRKMRQQFKWRAFGLGASHEGKGHVEEASARHDVDQFCMIPASTMDICRPKDRTSSSFLLLENFIRETVSGFTDPNRLKLPFKSDPRYVPLEHTVSEIRQRLEDPDVQVVVLYGDAGTGKSSLTMYLALQLEEESVFPDGIFYFPCGRGKEAVTVLRNMLRQLHVHQSRISSNDEDEMLLLLREQLQNRNALMILDDVWDDERVSLVEKVVVPGARKVKYLFSSQQSHGWELSGYSTCGIEPINLVTAQQIIIKHVGLRDDEIPKDDADTVNEIIGMTDFHPLALATVSGSVRVDSEGRVRQAVWKKLRQSLLFYLAEDDPAAYVTSFGAPYPRSVFAAMMYAVDLLFKRKDESLYLMCIMALFEGPFPTALIHMVILCTRPKLSRHVSRLISRLRDRQLVQHACTSALHRSRTYCLPPSIFRNPYAYELSCPCFLKMHSLRQQFILTCAEYDSSFTNSVEVIKETLAPFLSGSNFRGADEFDHREEHPRPEVLITALCVLYGTGFAEVKNTASRYLNYKLKTPDHGHVNSKGTLELLILPADTEERNISTSVPKRSFLEAALSGKAPDVKLLSDLDHPRICLEVLMAGIEEHSTSTSVQCALQKVVWKYMFRLQIDDDNLSFLIAEGYHSALTFLMHYLPGACKRLALGDSERSTDKVFSSVLRSLAAAASLLRYEMQSSTTSLMVLNLLQQLAQRLQCHMMSVDVDVFDLELLINVFYRVHDSRLDLSSILIQIFGRLAENRFQLIFLRTRPGMQEAISSVIQKLVADLNDDRNLELLGNSNGWYSYEIDHLLTDVIHQVDTVLRAVGLVCDLWPGTFGEENVVATVNSISNPLQALFRLFPQALSDIHCGHLLQAVVSSVGRKDRIGRSVIWSIPGATQAIVSIVHKPMIQQKPYAADTGMRLLNGWTSAVVDDHAIRSYLFSEGFVDVLVDVIGDYTAKIISACGWRDTIVDGEHALAIIENFVTSDDTAASVCASLPKLHRVLCDLLSVRPSAICTCTEYPDVCRHALTSAEICPCLHRSALTVLLYLGYSIGVSDDKNRSGCCILRAVTPNHSHSALVESSHAVKVQRAFESLFEIFDNNGQRVAQVAALDLLGCLFKKHSSARARIYAMPTIAATRLTVLLHGDVDAGVKDLALNEILELADGSLSDAANRFMREIVLIPGVLERMVELMGYDWDGRESAIVFLYRYLELDPESAPRILAVRDVVLSVVVSLQNKDQHVRKIVRTLYFLLKFSEASGSVYFFLSVRGSLEALVELLAHSTPKLVEHAQPGPALELRLRHQTLPHRTAEIREHERTELLLFITYCLDFLILLATKSDEAVNRMVAAGGVFDPMIDLLYNKQWETIEGSCACSDPCHETQKWRALEFLILLASRSRNALPEKIIEFVSSALQDHVDLLTNINGAQVPGVLKSLLALVGSSKESRLFVLKAPGAFESLISLSVHHEQPTTRADALHILRLSLVHIVDFQDNAFTPCLLKVLDVLPELVDQLRQCPTEQEDYVALQCSVIEFLGLLATIGREHKKIEIQSRILSKLTSLILYNPQVLQNLAGLLQRDEYHECNIQKGVMYFLSLTTRDTVKGMFLIVQIPGTLERIVELVYRRNLYAFLFVQNLISTGKLHRNAPRYLLKCLVHLVSCNVESVTSEALQLLGLCALQNKDALYYLIDTLHKSVRCTLRAEALNYFIAHLSDSPERPTRTLLASLQSFVHDATRHEYLEPACDLQVEVLCILVSLVKRSPQNQWRIANYVTGICAHNLLCAKARDTRSLQGVEEYSMDAGSS